jgi:uncharacterized protein
MLHTLLNYRFKLLLSLSFIAIFTALGLGAAVKAQGTNDLWIYVANDRADQVQSLLDKGVDPNTTNARMGNPILIQAVRDGSWTVFDAVLAHPKTNIDLTNGYQESPLMYVSLEGDLPRVKKLIAMGAEFNHLGWTPLHYAAAKGQLPVVQFLLAQGALPNTPAPDGSSPILMAAQAGAIDTAVALLEAGADPAAVNSAGLDAPTAARERGNTQLAEILQQAIQKQRTSQ